MHTNALEILESQIYMNVDVLKFGWIFLPQIFYIFHICTFSPFIKSKLKIKKVLL